MKRTSFFSRLVSSAARSFGFSNTGPEVCRRFTPSSWAMMCERVVLPRPGGPNSSTWSSASPRLRAAPMKISSCSRVLAWPTYSARPLGRSARSRASSAGETGAAETTRFDGGGGTKSSVWMDIRTPPAARRSSRQRLQRLLDAVAHAGVLGQRLQRRLRFLVAVAQRHQRLQDVGLVVVHHRMADVSEVGADLAFEFQQQALRRLLADPRDLHQPAGILLGD